MTWTVPTPEEQVLFLRNIQRLLAEGQFVASYKFALLLALADLAVLKGDDTGAHWIWTRRTSPPSSSNSTGSNADHSRSAAALRDSSSSRILASRRRSFPISFRHIRNAEPRSFA